MAHASIVNAKLRFSQRYNGTLTGASLSFCVNKGGKTLKTRPTMEGRVTTAKKRVRSQQRRGWRGVLKTQGTKGIAPSASLISVRINSRTVKAGITNVPADGRSGGIGGCEGGGGRAGGGMGVFALRRGIRKVVMM